MARETAYQIIERQGKANEQQAQKIIDLKAIVARQVKIIADLRAIVDRQNNSPKPANKPPPPIVDILTQLFRKKPLWSSTDLKLCVKASGLSRNLLFDNPEVDELPIYKFRADDDDAADEGLEEGEVYWRAKKGWPS